MCLLACNDDGRTAPVVRCAVQAQTAVCLRTIGIFCSIFCKRICRHWSDPDSEFHCEGGLAKRFDYLKGVGHSSVSWQCLIHTQWFLPLRLEQADWLVELASSARALVNGVLGTLPAVLHLDTTRFSKTMEQQHMDIYNAYLDRKHSRYQSKSRPTMQPDGLQA